MMRRIIHPGPPAPQRRRIVPCRIERLKLTLGSGMSINAASAAAFADAGFESGFIRLRNAPAAPLRYVIPAASPDADHAAWYSGTHAPEGVSVVEDMGVIVGRKDGEPFIHGHGIWRTSEGRRMGHILPLDSELAEPVAAEAFGISGGCFDVRDDAETNFRLFAAQSSAPAGTGTRGLICTLRPNEEISAAVEAICRDHGFRHAAIHGIGSLVGCDFEDGWHVRSYATEVLISRGTVELEGERPSSTFDIALVDMDGELHEGRLAPCRNTVCVTFELLIVETDTGENFDPSSASAGRP